MRHLVGTAGSDSGHESAGGTLEAVDVNAASSFRCVTDDDASQTD